MDTVVSIQKAIDFMEDHILDELKFEAIAAQAYMSTYHFQRVFLILCNITLGEYIRNRRLALAAFELQTTKAKVIDVALKYGYDSPESFSRAFTRFHGVPPTTARSRGCDIRPFAKISIQSIYERERDIMERIKKRGYTFKSHAQPAYHTKDMDKTVKWFEEVLGWYAGIDARDENGVGTYGCAMSFPGEIVHIGVGEFDGIHLFYGEPSKKTVAFIGVQNIDELYAFVKKNGWDQITEVSPPQPWGARICFVTTIDGSVLQFWE
jgi:AraC family transcriptional regulator